VPLPYHALHMLRCAREKISQSQIGPADFRLGGQLRWHALGEDAALGDDIGIVAERQGQMHLSCRQELRDHDRRQAERDLVDDEDLRIGHQPVRDRDHLLLAAGERAASQSGARLT
jgi:hypothetical protein